MKIKRGFKTELDPTPEQYVLFCQCAGAARFAYNYGLARKREAYKAGQKTPTAIDLQKELTVRKREDLPWMAELSKWVVQNALRDLDCAFKNFFRTCALKKEGKHKGKCGYPKFKSKKKGRGSFRLDCPIYVEEDAIQLPKIGLVKLKEQDYLPIRGVKVLFATVSEQAGRWFVSVQCECEVPEPEPATGPVIGVDLGIKTLATLSTGETIANPKALRRRLKQVRRLSRRHSRKKKGGKNREKARRKLARQHAKIANLRRDTLHKATAKLVAKTKLPEEQPGVIVIEDLNIQGMLKNRKLSRAISDVGMYEFKRQLRYKTAWYGITLKEVSRWYPSSKTCSGCGAVREDLDLSERVFLCYECGLILDRDSNAALNLAASA
jgi:putative transposase